MKKNKNRYRIASMRLQSWDYGDNSPYFITICTYNRICFFGNILNNEMFLNEIGQIAKFFWTEISKQFPFIELGNFVVMPNHIHGILIINKNQNDSNLSNVDTKFISSQNHQIKKNGGFAGTKNPMAHENISRIIRWYKGRCSFEIHKIQPDFAWQTRFHDHIIRNAKSFENIQNYIENNPLNWNKDKFSGK